MPYKQKHVSKKTFQINSNFLFTGFLQCPAHKEIVSFHIIPNAYQVAQNPLVAAFWKKFENTAHKDQPSESTWAAVRNAHPGIFTALKK